MKYTNLKAFEKHLESASLLHFSDLYMILGKDSFGRKSAQDLLIRCLLRGKAQAEFSLQIYEAERLNIEELLHELNALTMFSDKRVIVINDIDKLPKSNLEKIENYFSRPNSALYLVVSAAAINHATNFYKKAEKLGVVLDLPEEKPWEKEKSMKEWVISKAASMNKKIDGHSAQYLLKQIGTDQATVFQELEKLFCYIGERSDITQSDISAICNSVNVENIWQLGEAIFRRDPQTALRISKATLEEGVPLFSLVRQIRYQVQTGYQICSILANGGSGVEVSQLFPNLRGQILERNIDCARSYGMENFKNAMIKIDETELQAKNSMVDHDFLIELLIVKLSVNK